MAKLLDLCVFAASIFLLSGCSTGVVPLGRDTYMISGSQPVLVGSGVVRARLLREADAWCRKQGLVMVSLNWTGHDAVFGRMPANADLTFRAMPASNYENQRPNMERAVDYHQIVEVRNR